MLGETSIPMRFKINWEPHYQLLFELPFLRKKSIHFPLILKYLRYLNRTFSNDCHCLPLFYQLFKAQLSLTQEKTHYFVNNDPQQTLNETYIRVSVYGTLAIYAKERSGNTLETNSTIPNKEAWVRLIILNLSANMKRH